MCLRWTAAGMLEAERQFRRVIGYPKLPALAVAVERDLARTSTDTPAPEVRYRRLRQFTGDRRRNSTATGTSSRGSSRSRGIRRLARGGRRSESSPYG